MCDYIGIQTPTGKTGSDIFQFSFHVYPRRLCKIFCSMKAYINGVNVCRFYFNIHKIVIW